MARAKAKLQAKPTCFSVPVEPPSGFSHVYVMCAETAKEVAREALEAMPPGDAN